jgi:hypothetical protein
MWGLRQHTFNTGYCCWFMWGLGQHTHTQGIVGLCGTTGNTLLGIVVGLSGASDNTHILRVLLVYVVPRATHFTGYCCWFDVGPRATHFTGYCCWFMCFEQHFTVYCFWFMWGLWQHTNTQGIVGLCGASGNTLYWVLLLYGCRIVRPCIGCNGLLCPEAGWPITM